MQLQFKSTFNLIKLTFNLVQFIVLKTLLQFFERS